ncbi:metallophosphoesterase [Blastococcus sp. CT_GayMR19]|uniref:metallophosphoesterase family protein n=1 Tax=Blastococcus sp. CT_GayMR19 TaxID=2559608 RepID=UPI00142FA718|nr:metallophosphoesterase [Blastococcus sp. CT_GayMR19]
MKPRRRTPVPVRLPALLVALLLVSTGCSEGRATPTAPAETAGAGGQESERTEPAAATAVTIIGAGDIAGDREEAAATAALIQAAAPAAVFTTGDNAYPDGALSDYLEKYDPTWGAFKDRTNPVPGNHEYHSDPPAGYLAYFGAANVTNPVDGGAYYAWDVGNGWRAYALNTEISTSGAQLEWLQDDVAAHPGQHYILYTHRPRYTSSDNHGPSDDVCPLWDALALTGGLEIVLFGHNHQYERFAPMDCAGQAGDAGARSFVIGSGGKELYGFGPAQPGSEFRNDSDFGVLKFNLYESSYEWEFIASGRGQDGNGTMDTGNAGQILDKGSAAV